MRESASIFRDNPPGVADCLSRASVGIAGAGGIGSNVAWILARAGLGRLIVVDHDCVEERNLNRQFYFGDQTGMSKAAALTLNLLRINPALDLVAHQVRIDRGNACLLFRDADILVEALDLDSAKVMLLETWLEELPGVPVLSCSGLAGERRMESLRVDRRDGLIIVGDQETDLSEGTLSSRICMVSAMMASEVISILRGRT